jgi:hypothetical protein
VCEAVVVPTMRGAAPYSSAVAVLVSIMGGAKP